MARKSIRKPIVDFNTDWSDGYVGDGVDGVYYQTASYRGGAKGRRGWYVTAAVDSNTGSFVADLMVDDGPYPSMEAAQRAGLQAGVEWCVNNGVTIDPSIG